MPRFLLPARTLYDSKAYAFMTLHIDKVATPRRVVQRIPCLIGKLPHPAVLTLRPTASLYQSTKGTGQYVPAEAKTAGIKKISDRKWMIVVWIYEYTPTSGDTISRRPLAGL